MGSVDALRSLGLDCDWLAQSVHAYDEIDSTNLVAERLADEGATHGTLVVSDRQSAGRGRMGREFFSPGGTSLYLSLILRPKLDPDSLFQVIFGAAVCVAEAAAQFLPNSTRVEIKWPNDVMLDGRKTCGMNLPAKVEGKSVEWAVLGIGINVDNAQDHFPDELQEIATSLRIAAGTSVDRIAVGRSVLRRLEQTLEALDAGEFSGVLERWLEFFKMAGNRVRIAGPGVRVEVEGTVSGVDHDGALILETKKGTERVLAGDVHMIESSETLSG